jgi:hypothetical protein
MPSITILLRRGGRYLQNLTKAQKEMRLEVQKQFQTPDSKSVP